MTINEKKMTIEVTKAFAKRASKFNTKEYKDLQTVRRDYPNFEVVVRTTKANKSAIKGLTFEYMETYIKAHDDENNSIMKDFLDLRGLSEEAKEAMADSASYGEIKAWFFEQYPQIKKFHERRENLRAA